MSSVFELNMVKTAIMDFNDSCVAYKDLSNKKLKQEFSLSQPFDCVENIKKFFNITAEIIKRLYNYNITKNDLLILEKFLDKTCLNVSTNSDVFYAYLLYSLLFPLKGKKLFSIYMNRFLLIDNYVKSKVLYDFLKINSMINFSPFNYIFSDAKNSFKNKIEIYSNSIVYTTYEELLFDYIDNQNINIEEHRANVKPQFGFIFDIDKIICDLENCTFKVPDLGFKVSNIKILDYFKQFEGIVGVSPELFLKQEQTTLKELGLKTEILSSNKNILDYLKNPKNIFCESRERKIEEIKEKILEYKKENKAVIVDVDSKDDLELLIKTLKKSKVDFTLVDNDTFEYAGVAASVLNKSQVTILTNLLGAFLNPVLDDVYEYRAKIKKHCNNIGYRPEFQKNIQNKKSKDNKISSSNDLCLIFASHYLELENEFSIINNHIKNLNFDNITFYNCSDDEIFKRLNLDKIKFLNMKPARWNKFIFELISKYFYKIKEQLLLAPRVLEDSFLIYSINYGESDRKNQIFKIGKNEPCYCNSGLSYSNCCGKRNN